MCFKNFDLNISKWFVKQNLAKVLKRLRLLLKMKVFRSFKKSRPISRVLSPINRSLIIYLVPILLSGSIFLPFNNGREALDY